MRSRPTKNHSFTERWYPVQIGGSLLFEKTRLKDHPELFQLQFLPSSNCSTWLDWQPEMESDVVQSQFEPETERWRGRSRPGTDCEYTSWREVGPLDLPHCKDWVKASPDRNQLQQFDEEDGWVDYRPSNASSDVAPAASEAWQARATGGQWQTVPADMLQVWRDASAYRPEQYQLRRVGSEPISGALLIEALVDAGILFEEQSGDYRTMQCNDVSSKLTLAIELLGIAP